jgi:glutamate dehydrogenase/leucine dehydrogenase
VDCVAPCAFGGVLDDATIPRISAKVVCGAANNQLADPAVHDELLSARGIVYVPDFLANRMGIVNCANEAYGRVGANDEMMDPAITRSVCQQRGPVSSGVSACLSSHLNSAS